MTAAVLPAGMHVIMRDWLNANHVLFLHDENVLVDSGHWCGLATTRHEVEGLLRGRPLHTLANTHCHSDHMGGNAALRARYGCRVLVPEGEAARVRDWDTRALWLDYAGQRAQRFAYDASIEPGAQMTWGGLRWDALAAPGHDDGALMFHCARLGILISGDALWERGFGTVLADPPDGLQAARRTLELIADLDLRLVIPGHGPPFTDVRGALAASHARLDALATDPRRMARSALKTMLAFSLLERGPMDEAEARALVDSAPIYHEYNERFLQLPAPRLCEALLAELERARVIERVDGRLRAVG